MTNDSLNTQLLQGASTAPGRPRSYLINKADGYSDLLPYSCKLRVYRNNLLGELVSTAKDLRWGAGVKLVLDLYEDLKPLEGVEWGFYLDPAHPDFTKITSSQNLHYVVPTEKDTLIRVADCMDSPQDMQDVYGIEGSWVYFGDILWWLANHYDEKLSRRVVVDLSDLRPSGTSNSRGLTATGPVGDGSEESNTSSFVAIYEYLFNYLTEPSIGAFLQLFGVLNNTIRRGGIYKNGIITSSMHFTSEHFRDYLEFPLVDIPGSHKKGAGIDFRLLSHSNSVSSTRKLVLDKVREESLFLEKRDNAILADSHTPFPNVCVGGDTWVDTTEGPKQVHDLVGVPFNALVSGEVHSSTEQGFWSNGVQDVVTLNTQSGLQLKLTPNHTLIKATRKNYDSPWKEEWVEVQALVPGDSVKLSGNHHEWAGKGSFNQGWLVGNLIGDGFFVNDNSAKLQFFGDERHELIDTAYNILLNEPTVYYKNSSTPYPMTPSSDYVPANHNGPQRTVGGRVLGKLAIEWGLTREFKHNLAEIERRASSDFCRGLIRGLFDADSCVMQGNEDGSGKSIQFTQVSESVVRPVARILNRLGITTNLHHVPARETIIHGKTYNCQTGYRLDISGQANLLCYSELIGFHHPTKAAKLKALLDSYSRNAYATSNYTKVKSVTSSGECEVYDCTIPSLGYFSANGIIAHNCVGLLVPDDGTCLIWRVNLGKCENLHQIIGAYEETAERLSHLHLTWRDDNPERATHSAPLEEDRQIGIDVMGLANLLGIHHISYKEFIEEAKRCLKEVREWSVAALTEFVDFESITAYGIAYAILKGQQVAMAVADKTCVKHNVLPFQRMFCVEPAQSHSYETTDSAGFTTCRGIWPPLGRRVNFATSTRKGRTVRHGKVETVKSLSEDLYEELHEVFQQLLNHSGRAHCISYDLRREPTEEWLYHFIVDSPLKTKYYTEIASTNQDYLSKQIQEVTK